MSGLVMSAMPRVTRRYDNAAAASPQPQENDLAQKKTGAPSTGSGYAPVSLSNTPLHCVTFNWARGCPAYTLRGTSAIHAGGGRHVNRPVIGDLAMLPSTGRYLYEVRVNTACCKIGVCTQAAYSKEADLDACELGELPNGKKPQKLVPAGGQSAGDDEPLVAVLDGQTSKVIVNGKETKHLWRLFVATCGALFSFVVDTDDGVVQLFVDKKYAGMVFDASANLKGRTLYPCVSIAGLDMYNRSIGSGNLGAFVGAPRKFDCLY